MIAPSQLDLALDSTAISGSVQCLVPPLRVLVACEYSGTVREAFAARGHHAMSCDLLPTDRPGKHYQGDVRDVLDDGWDLMIAHPPCTYLSVSGIHWNDRGRGWEETEKALDFVRLLMGANIPKIAVENPVSIISSKIRKPDQIVQPWQFGHDASKATCLWLKNLPLLKPTKYVEPQYFCCGLPLDVEAVGMRGCANCEGDKLARPRWGNQTASGQNKLAPSKDRWKVRSTTYPGIADAMAIHWGNRELSQPPSVDNT
jgi:hypothetical protein